eukprot:365322-Chlamydomonas_euryale.AAC.10
MVTTKVLHQVGNGRAFLRLHLTEYQADGGMRATLRVQAPQQTSSPGSPSSIFPTPDKHGTSALAVSIVMTTC